MAHAITTRSGLNYNPPKNPLKEVNDTQNNTTENISTKIEVTPDSQRNITETSAPPIPFPRRLKKEKEKEKEQFQKFFKNLQRLSINIPFIKALEQMPKYAKFMKDLLAQRGRGNEEITLNERCSAVILNEIPLKEKDPRSFTILCVIGQSGINKALADLEASISLMP
ncbi:hypothetical protein Tco_0963124 [Tanacetum coccineum]